MWKECTKCGEIKPLYSFHKDKSGAFGLRYFCIKCVSDYQKGEKRQAAERMRRWRKSNPEKNRAQSALNYRRTLDKDPDYFKKWQMVNKDKCRESERRYSKNNPSKIAAKAARRRIKRKEQTVSLSSREEKMVQIIYSRSQDMGPDYVVDHITPVSRGGSDHPTNLQIITAEENGKKSNKFNYKVKGIRLFWGNNRLIEEING